MNNSRPILWIACFLLSSTSLFSQLTSEDLFLRPGLTFGAYDFDDTHQETDRGYIFEEIITLCDEEVYAYREIDIPYPHYAQIVGNKVYRVQGPCGAEKELLYDFDMAVGDTVTSGYYEGYVVQKRFPVLLENDELRFALYLKKEDPDQDFFGATWINGIGDSRRGLFPIPKYYWETRLLACVKEYDELLIFNGNEEKCAHYTCLDPKLSFNVEEDELTVSIENLSTNAENYLWDFGDGSTSTEEQPVHEYAMGGCYTITLTVNNECFGEKVKQERNQICLSDVWQEKPLPSSIGNYLYLIHASDQVTFMRRGSNLYYSNDEGDNWKTSVLPIPDSTSGIGVGDVKMFDENRGVLAAYISSPTANAEGLFYTEDGGASWNRSDSGKSQLVQCTVLPNGKGWALGRDELFVYTENFGQNWIDITASDPIKFEDIWSFDSGTLIGIIDQPIGINKINIGWSLDNGNTWNIGAPNNSSFKIEFVSDQVAYGFKNWGEGLYKTIDQGETWDLIDSTLKVREVKFFDENRGWIATRGADTYYTEDGGATFNLGNCNRFAIYDLAPLGPRKALGLSGISWNELVSFDLDGVTSCLFIDNDMDGFADDEDCDDNNASVNPDAMEIPYNGLDDDCDALTLDDDLDQDGFLLAEDCDDNNAAINPDAVDIPNNGIDENCDGSDMIVSTQDLAIMAPQVFPNPTKNNLNILAFGNAPIQVYLTNSKGQLLNKQQFSESTILELAHYPKGIYFLRLSNSEGHWVERVVKLD